MSEILIVEDHPATYRSLTRYLRRTGYQVYHRGNGQEALEFVQTRTFNLELIILDVMLPGLNGLEVVKRIRRRGVEVPVLMLTSLGDTDHIVQALQAGADDYLSKPFALAELHARIRSLLRRPQHYERRKLVKGNFEIDIERREFSLNGEKVLLRRKEFDMLHLFLTYPSQTLSRDFIIMNVWGGDKLPSQNSVDVHVRRLRTKIGDENHQLLETVHGFGYRLNVGHWESQYYLCSASLAIGDIDCPLELFLHDRLHNSQS